MGTVDPNLTARTPKIRAITTQSKLMFLFIFLRSPERRRFSTRNTQRNGDQPPSNPQIENQTPNIGKLQHILRNHASAVMILELDLPLASSCPAETKRNSKQRKAPSKPTNEEEEEDPWIFAADQQKTPKQEATRRGKRIPNPVPPPHRPVDGPGARDDEVEKGSEELIPLKQRHLHLAAAAGKKPDAVAARRNRESAVDVGEGHADSRSGFTVSTPPSHAEPAAAQEERTTPHRRHGQT